LQVCYQK